MIAILFNLLLSKEGILWIIFLHTWDSTKKGCFAPQCQENFKLLYKKTRKTYCDHACEH